MRLISASMKQAIKFFLMLLLVCPSFASAENAFVIKSVSTRLNGTVHFLDAEFEINLPAYIASAFEKGFDLPLVIEIVVARYRGYWFNAEVVKIRQQYLLQYHAIIDSVTLINVNSGSRQHFLSLKEALAYLSKLRNFPLLDNNSLKQDTHYQATIKFGIDVAELPIPLKSSSWWENDWDLVSEPKGWNISQ